jgi:putative phosphoesterase
MRIAVVSDTHGLLRPELLPLIHGADHILHAGDIGDPAILDALRTIAPVTAIRGNIDTHGPCALLPATEAIELDGQLLYMLHSRRDLDLNPEAAGIAVVVSGHSHQPSIETHRGVLYLNPGSCGPRRFSLPITFAWLTLTDGTPTAEITPLTHL